MQRNVLEILENRQATINAYDTERVMEGHDAPGEIAWESVRGGRGGSW